jgi:hypothetical protein
LFVWIIGAPVLNSKYFIVSIPGFVFDFHLNRILFLIFSILIFNHFFKINSHVIKTENNKNIIDHPFEIWLIVYIGVVLFSILINTLSNYLSLKYFASILISQLFLFLLYICIKYFSTYNLLATFKVTITRFSVIFSIIAIIQTFVISDFFRFSEPRLAFGEIFRASGIFYNEYTLAFFCITSLIILLVEDSKKYISMGIIFFATLITFHRLSILTLLISFAIYSCFFIHRKKTHLLIYTLCLSTAICLFYLVAFKNYTVDKFTSTQIYRDRLSVDTLSDRFDQYKNAIKIISNYPFGYGSYESERYVYSAAEIGQLHLKRMYDYDNKQYIGFKIAGLIIHNSFLGAGAKYGFLGMFTYFMFCLSSVLYAFNIYRKFKNNNSIILLSICICWCFFQTSQDFSDFNKYHSIYFIIILGVFSNHFKRTSKYPENTYNRQ